MSDEDGDGWGDYEQEDVDYDLIAPSLEKKESQTEALKVFKTGK